MFVVVVNDQYLVLIMQLLLILIVLRLEIFPSLRSFGKCFSTRARNLCPILVLMFLLNGGLYQSMLFPCLFFCLLVMGGLCRVYQYPHLSSAFWYGGAAWLKDALWDERDDCLLCMPVGMFFVVVGGYNSASKRCNLCLKEKLFIIC